MPLCKLLLVTESHSNLCTCWCTECLPISLQISEGVGSFWLRRISYSNDSAVGNRPWGMRMANNIAKIDLGDWEWGGGVCVGGAL